MVLGDQPDDGAELLAIGSATVIFPERGLPRIAVEIGA
jgi:hypothetical protein